MPEFPFRQTDKTKGEKLLQSAERGQLLFSEGTYQVEIIDQGKSFWPFLQLSDSGKLLDAFCECTTDQKKPSCPHLAAAFHRIFRDKNVPLHVRFRGSLWNQLCQMAARRHGYDLEGLTFSKPSSYAATSVTGKRLFLVEPLNAQGKKKLEEILVNRPIETEETSLKFSNLPPEELVLWRQGRASPHLRYELSFWSDLAKWWMLLQEEGEEPAIEFSASDGGLPKWITLRFEEVKAEFYVAEVNWRQVIPSLSTVASPLAVYDLARGKIESIHYDPQKKRLLIHSSQQQGRPRELPPDQGKGIPLGEWRYIPNLGFYPAELDPLLKEKEIPEKKISLFLQKHVALLQKYLVGAVLHPDPLKGQYQLFFDENANLHLSCYLFEQGDLQRGHSTYFGPWVYLDGKGFYLLEQPLFDEVEKVIPKEKVSDFINRHRHWLQAYEGFQTHVSSLESYLSYSLRPDRSLIFEAHLDLLEEGGEMIDLGDWVYLKGRGFYAKMSRRTGSVLRAGMVVKAPEISRFIHLHREELEQIRKFFSSRSPIQQCGVMISLDASSQIVVTPKYTLRSPYATKNVEIFGDYTYVPKEGFCEIPPGTRLPEAYTHETKISKKAEPYFLAYELEQLQPHILSIDPRLVPPQRLVLHTSRIRKEEAGHWLIDLNYETESGEVRASEIWRALQDNEHHLFTSAGLIFLSQSRFNWLKKIPKNRWLKSGCEIRLSTLEWIRLSILEEIKEPEDRDSLALLAQFQELQADRPLPLEGLRSQLRSYQEMGVRWLWFLYCNGLSGLLCDEMGLGKTHQAMALIAAVSNSHPDCRILVVCPTSVIYHWEDLLKRFLPHLKVHLFYGVQRELKKEAQLLLTSYGVLRSEKKALSEIPFEVAVFDEVQIAKNAHSQTHKALRAIEAKMVLGLTGTPIENRLLELKALFDLILPSYFPSEAHFREFFITPIERNEDPERKILLARLIKPFLLRRKKQEVLLELPEKIEEIAYSDLSEEQANLYRDVIEDQRESLLSDLQDESKPAPYMHVFSLLSSLKQICDHPCLYTKKWEDYKQHASGKWDLFVELLEETRDSGQKLVVFSQYLDMLNIIEAHLKEKGIGFAGIRGATRDRKEQIAKFREDPKCEVFVASLQAAGVGIDLVAASVVIHYDRWWNPARENQATDRVHRMGQNRGVQVFKMVTKGTVEEHIHALIERKKSLSEGVIGFDDQDQIKALDRKELTELLQLLSR